jgi:transmembrane sensor
MTQSHEPDSTDPEKLDDPAIAEALDWFVRLQAAQGDARTARAFREWMEGDPRRGDAFSKVVAAWGAPEFLLAARNVAEATGFVAPRRKSRRRARAAKAGAAVALALLALAQAPELLLRLRADHLTAAGEQRTIALPDGSSMTLNTGTAVALDFAEGRRRVSLLRGEAYFDVLPDRGRSFEVVGRFGRVVVKGTAFSVKLDAEEDDVVLGRGAVDVARRAQPRDHAVLAPGETVAVTAGAVSPVTRVDTARSLAWLEGRISFHDQPLAKVLDDIRRYYPGRIFVLRPGVEQIAVSGNYRLDRPALIVESLAEAAGATMTTLPGGVIILR